jgi:hypothetical protein
MPQRNPAMGGTVTANQAGTRCFPGRTIRQGWGAQPPEKRLASLGFLTVSRMERQAVINNAGPIWVRIT